MSKLTNNPGICRFGGILSTIILLIGMIVLGAITADNYSITQRLDKQSTQIQQQVNETVAQILQTQDNNNERGNQSLAYFTKIFKTMLKIEENNQGNLTDHRRIANMTRDMLAELINETESSSQQSLINQEQYFKPYLNQSFDKIFKALNITGG